MIDIYIQIIKLWYIYLPKQKKQIFSKFKQQIMYALNIRKKNIQEQKKPRFDFYRDSLEEMIDSNIDNRVSDKNNFLWQSKSNISALSLKQLVLLLSRLFGNSTMAINSKNNNSSTFLLRNLSTKLPLSIIPNDLLNLLLKSNDFKL